MFSRQKGGFRHGFVNAVLVFFLIYRGSFGWNIELFGLVCFCVDAIFRIEYFGGFDRLGREKMLEVFLLAGCLRVWLSYEEVCYWYRGNMGFFSHGFFSHGIIFFPHGMHGKFCLFPTDYTDFSDIYLPLLFDSLFDCVKIALRMTQMPCGVLLY